MNLVQKLYLIGQNKEVQIMIYSILNTIFNLLELAIFIECISSWIPQFQGSRFIGLVHNVTHNILEPFRRLQDRFSPGLPMDFSPIIALFAIDLIKRLLIGILY